MALQPSVHEDYTRTTDVTGSSDRAFGLVFAGFFTVVTGVLFWRRREIVLWPVVAAAAFALVALAAPRVLAPLNRLWTRFGALLHRVTSPIILGFLYAIAIVPVGLLMRLFKQDPLRLRFEPDRQSYWIVREKTGPLRESLTRQF